MNDLMVCSLNEQQINWLLKLKEGEHIRITDVKVSIGTLVKISGVSKTYIWNWTNAGLFDGHVVQENGNIGSWYDLKPCMKIINELKEKKKRKEK